MELVFPSPLLSFSLLFSVIAFQLLSFCEGTGGAGEGMQEESSLASTTLPSWDSFAK